MKQESLLTHTLIEKKVGPDTWYDFPALQEELPAQGLQVKHILASRKGRGQLSGFRHVYIRADEGKGNSEMYQPVY